MLAIPLELTFWAMTEFRLAELAATSGTLLAVLAGAGVELWKPETGLVGLIARVVFACVLMPGSDDIIIGGSDPHAGV